MVNFLGSSLCDPIHRVEPCFIHVALCLSIRTSLPVYIAVNQSVSWTVNLHIWLPVSPSINKSRCVLIILSGCLFDCLSAHSIGKIANCHLVCGLAHCLAAVWLDCISGYRTYPCNFSDLRQITHLVFFLIRTQVMFIVRKEIVNINNMKH